MRTSAKVLLGAVIAVLVAAIGVQAGLLVQRKRELAVMRASHQERKDFCLAYAGMINSVRHWINAAQIRSDDRTPGWVFHWLTNPAFLKVCRVAEPTRSTITNRKLRLCRRGFEEDLKCLEELARELEGAISIY